MRYGTGAALVVLAGVVWSLQGLIFRMIDPAASPWAVLFWRSAGMIPVLTTLVALTGEGGLATRFRAVGWAGVLAAFGLVLAFGGAIYSLQKTSVAMAVFLFSASPFVAAALSWLILREAVRRGTWAAVALAAVGIGLMVSEGLAVGALAGNVAALLSALGFAAFTLALRWGRLGDMIPAVVLGGVFSMIVAACIAPVMGESLILPARDTAIAMAMGACTLAGGMVLYTFGVKALPAAEASLLSLVEVLLAPIWVWVALGETASRGTLIGGAVLVAAVAVNALTGMRRKPPPPMV